MKFVNLNSQFKASFITVCIAALLAAVFVIASNKAPSTKEFENSRIKLVEQTRIDGKYHYIIKVDSNEFLLDGRGGIAPIIK